MKQDGGHTAFVIERVEGLGSTTQTADCFRFQQSSLSSHCDTAW